MEIIRANRNNISSIIMGKNIQFNWRGQSDLTILVPYIEWLEFIKEYKDYLKYRKPLDYNLMLQSDDEDIKYRFFYYDISWALYSELALSSDIGKGSTLILPYWEDGESLTLVDAINAVNAMSEEDKIKFHNSLKSATKNYHNIIGSSDYAYGIINVDKLSQWNYAIFLIVLYLQARSNKKNKTEKINLKWG